MARKKRVTRKQLLKEPDEFLTLSAKMIRFAVENRRALSYALIGFIVVGLAVAAFRYFSGLSERRAYSLFQEGFAHYINQEPGEKTSHLFVTAKNKFAEVIDKYPSTIAGRLSLPLYADMCYEEGSYEKAIEVYERALHVFSKKDDLLPIIWNGLAYAYEGKKDYQAAVKCFRQIMSLEGKFMKGDACFNLGRMYEALKNRQKALEAYERVTKDYPGSVHFQVAKEKIQRLKA